MSDSRMDGNNKDKTQSHFYIPRGKEDDLRTTLRKHFSHLRLKLQLQPIMIDNKNWTANDRSWLPVLTQGDHKNAAKNS